MEKDHVATGRPLILRGSYTVLSVAAPTFVRFYAVLLGERITASGSPDFFHV